MMVSVSVSVSVSAKPFINEKLKVNICVELFEFPAPPDLLCRLTFVERARDPGISDDDDKLHLT